MAKQLFKFNHHMMDLIPVKLNAGKVLLVIFKYLSFSLLIAILYYVVFALVYDTGEEKALAAENAYLEAQCEEDLQRIVMLENATENLHLRDLAIYREVFDCDLPDYVLNSTGQQGPDYSRLFNDRETDLLSEMADIVQRCDKTAAGVTRNIALIFELLGKEEIDGTSIPSSVPLRNFSVGQTGASAGDKFSPFFKTLKRHDGLDIMAPEGAEVLASANGTVLSVQKSRRDGGCVVIGHHGTLTTEYKHLEGIMVHPGQDVKRGTPIARVGSSGRSFAPHLHYEVKRDGIPMDPSHFFFSDLGPQACYNVAILGLITGQSLD